MSALRIAPVGRLVTTYTLDEAADWLLGIALAVYVWGRTESALAVAALLLASRFGPSLVITPLAGRLGDARLGAALGGLYAGAAAVAVALAVGAGAPLPLLYALTFAATTLAATARVLTRTAACNVLDEHGRLREGAAALNVSTGAVSVLGPALAGAMTVVAGTQATVVVGAVVFGALAVSTWSLRVAVAGEEDGPPAATLREALGLLAGGRGVAAVLLAATALLTLFSMDEPIMLPYVEQALGGGAAQYAALMTIWGVGLLLGGGAFALLRHRSMLGAFVLAGGMLAGAYLILGAAHSPAVAYGAGILGGIGNGMFWGAFTVVTLEAVPAAVRTRTSGVIESVALATPGIGYVLGGGLSELLSPAEVYLLAGAAGASVVLALAVSLWRPSARAAALPRATGAPSPVNAA